MNTFVTYATVANMPKTACEISHLSRYQRNSKKPTMPITDSVCAMAAITVPNLPQHEDNMGPAKSDMKKRVRRTTAFQAMGPRETMARRRRASTGGFAIDLTKL